MQGLNFGQYSLRLITGDDTLEYFQMVERNRERLSNFFTGTVTRTSTLEETDLFVKEMLSKIDQKIYYPYLLLQATDKIIGFFDIKNIDWSVPKGELGCYIDNEYSGKGITCKTLEKFTNYCFEYYGFKKLFLRTHKSNIAAQKIAEKCGFELEGTIRRDYKTTSGELVDLLYYGKLSYK